MMYAYKVREHVEGKVRLTNLHAQQILHAVMAEQDMTQLLALVEVLPWLQTQDQAKENANDLRAGIKIMFECENADNTWGVSTRGQNLQDKMLAKWQEIKSQRGVKRADGMDNLLVICDADSSDAKRSKTDP